MAEQIREGLTAEEGRAQAKRRGTLLFQSTDQEGLGVINGVGDPFKREPGISRTLLGVGAKGYGSVVNLKGIKHPSTGNPHNWGSALGKFRQKVDWSERVGVRGNSSLIDTRMLRR